MLVEPASTVFDGRLRITARGCGTHDVCDADVGAASVIRRHAAADVTLGDDANQLEVFGVCHDWCAAAA